MARSRREIELLAPAGGPEELRAALAAGADAVFCGYGQAFNARRGAESFNAETFAEACRIAHLAGARIYVTVNVVVKADEMASVLALVRRAWLLGADAMIIQDLGLLREVRRLWPEVECHLSTQANVHDARGALWATEHGVSRVTLSRELTLTEISSIADAGVEVECFGHGAICICYSGICHMSSTGGVRSANRGACAQPCRLPYDLIDERGRVLNAKGRGRPLCPKDICTLDLLAELDEAGVSSLKVEGRLKGADYVHAVISAYRDGLDELYGRKDASECGAAGAARRERLVRRAFNRDLTSAYLMGTSGDEMMSYDRSNNRGEVVGTLVASRSFGTVKVRRKGGSGGRERLRTMRVCEVDIALSAPVGKGDLLEVRPVSDPTQFFTTHAPADAREGTTICCKASRTAEEGSIVRVIRSQAALDAAAQAVARDVVARRGVSVVVRARLGMPFAVELRTLDGGAVGRAEGPVVEPARTRVVSAEEVGEHVCRMGATPFEPVSCEVGLDEGVGLSFSQVHGVRAEAARLLEEELLRPYAERTLSKAPSPQALARGAALALRRSGESSLAHDGSGAVEVCAIVTCAEAARAVAAAGATRIYASCDALGQGEWPEGVIAVLDEVCREGDHARCDPWVLPGIPVAVGNLSELALCSEVGARAEIRHTIPVHNAHALASLVEAGAHGLWLSGELSLTEMAGLARVSPVATGVVAFGRVRAMTCEHCVLQVADACVHDCARCGLRGRRLFLRNPDGETYPVRTDLQGRTRVYGPDVIDIVPEVRELVEAGITRLAVDATLLAPAEAAREVARLAEAVARAACGKTPLERTQGAVTGHLFEAIS